MIFMKRTGHTLNGRHNYIMHFPAAELPPNHVFWSLTMSDAKKCFVATQSISRSMIS
jgi:hypothetical protein